MSITKGMNGQNGGHHTESLPSGQPPYSRVSFSVERHIKINIPFLVRAVPQKHYEGLGGYPWVLSGIMKVHLR